MAFQKTLTVSTKGKGLHLITREVERAMAGAPLGSGVLHLYIQHTSASLLIQENADPSARADLETFLDRLAPEGESWHTHLAEGPDDTVSHLKAALTPTSLTVPFSDGRLQLGTWQGIYLWEHRSLPHKRSLVLTLLS